jgi:type I restriction enzyme, R subunit
MQLITNFGFLNKDHTRLATLGVLAERYFRDDPCTSIFKVRQFAELLCKIVAARHASYLDDRETFEATLRRLSFENILPPDVARLFHVVRKAGNAAAHEAAGTYAEALSALKIARELGVWFHRVYAGQPNFKPGAFIPPPEPVDASASLKAEIADLTKKLADSEDTAARAHRVAEEQAKARETAEQRLAREAEEKAVWEKLAAETEAEKNDIAARLAALQAAATAAPPAESLALVQAGQKEASHIVLDEAATRTLIDQQLRDAGWEADTETVRYKAGVRPAKGRNLAIAEWPTASGPADYALFVGLTLVAVVEAKRRNKSVSSALGQAERYAIGFKADDSFSFAGGPWGHFKVPFVFSANGRPFLKQIETESGVWFRDTRRPTNLSRALLAWPTPLGLTGQLEQDQDKAEEALKDLPFNFGFPLREYQQAAILAVEKALADGRRNMLIAMATGTGKTKLSIAMLYRLLATKRFRRICFVVDRSALGDQAEDDFRTTKIVSGKAFADIFGLKALEDVAPETETKVHICTIQGLVKRVLYADDPGDAPPVDQYDLIVVDECHRGYLLDREMSDSELSFRNQDDYVSKYRRVLEYFDAVKIGLTATPALHTVQIFGEPIFKYSYRDAVVEGFLNDHEPPVRMTTALAKAGIVFKKDEQLDIFDTKTGEVVESFAPDEISFEVEEFNKKVITRDFNRVVAEELAKQIDPTFGKTLVFAVTDAHADIVVDELKKAFAAQYGEIDNDAICKITGSVDRPKKLIRSYRNDTNPRIAVTVDLLTTGIDIPSIVNLVFLRRVNSRILYDQMIGRATRLCPEIEKGAFRIFDAVDLYSQLQKLTDMKPVVVNPKISFDQLVKDLLVGDGALYQKDVRDQLAVKLRRRLRHLSERARALFETVAGETPEQALKRLLESEPAAVAEWLKPRAAIGPILDWQSDDVVPHYLPISTHEDSMVSVTRGFGDVDRPEDFLDGFTAFVRANVNAVAALTVVVQRPRELTRQSLIELRRVLDAEGFSEASLHRAWADAKNVDIAASIIGYVRQAALGDPLVPYTDRVRAAIGRVLSSRAWTEPQKKWLRRIGEQVEREIVVDRAALDRDPFANDGGFTRLNKVFGGELEAVLANINEELWKRAS